ncbi:MAG: hypothetical protein KDK35_21120 [Leptospiraceae bacterium]|nr:hypothetical protein [Leptospiraceae bacterium]MCP5484281.1 hypothetical protein [Spirochaetales bacterium]
MIPWGCDILGHTRELLSGPMSITGCGFGSNRHDAGFRSREFRLLEEARPLRHNQEAKRFR